MVIITGTDSDFGRLVVEEYRRRAQRVVDLGQATPDTAVDETGADHTCKEPSRMTDRLRPRGECCS